MNIFNWFEIKKIEKNIPIINGNQIKFGWIRDLPDPRDFKFKVPAPIELPELVDFRLQCPLIYDQGESNSCTANAMGGAFQFEQISQKKQDFMPSRLFIYYNTRVLEGTVNSDCGATLRDTMKTLVDNGVCPESKWGFNLSKLTVKPNCCCYYTAKKNQVLQYLSVTRNLTEIKSCLAEGYPIAFGFIVFESFMTDSVKNSGIAVMPLLSEQALGGHAVLIVGYDNSKNALIVRNSWGTNWGLSGYFYLPYEYITTPNLASDFWTIRLVE
jgi:C1A family cysteine protease